MLKRATLILELIGSDVIACVWYVSKHLNKVLEDETVTFYDQI